MRASDGGHQTIAADRAEIARFVTTIFPHADEGSYVNLRTFEHERDRPPVEIRAVRINGEGLEPVIAQATGAATRAARHPKPTVFAPIPCTFKDDGKAEQANVRNGVAVFVDIDEADPRKGRERLERLLGPASAVVASGGVWVDPTTGEVEDRVHLYWTLTEPTRAPEEHARLNRACKLASAIVGGDPSAGLVHPMRWPGSWHRKGEPRQARGRYTDAKVDLDDALERLEQSATLALEHANGAAAERLRIALEVRGEGQRREAPEHDPDARDLDLGALADAIPNEDEPRAEYVAVGLAFFAASDGLAAGFNAFDRWARKSSKYHGGTAKQWAHFAKSPPDRTGKGALVERARRADPTFRLPSWRPEKPFEKANDTETAQQRQRRCIKLSDERWNAAMAACVGQLDDIVYLRGTLPAMLARAAELGGKNIQDKDGASVDIAGVRHPAGSLLFVDAMAARVAWHLDERVSFERYVRREKEWVPTRCPKELAASIVDAAVFLDFRACAGIVHTPLLINGKLVASSGYHAPTGLILDLRGPQLNVPDKPDKAAAMAALQRLLRPFRGYLKNSSANQAAVAAAALTAAARPSLPTCPGIVIDGNNPGVGKGKLARILSAINAGTLPAIVTEGHSPEETEKRLAAAVLQGAPAILFDNLQRHVASSTLESMLTEPVADIRVFGKLANLRVACRSLLLLTANNASLRRDMLRRSLPVRIVVPDEKPELREFDFDPVDEAMTERTELLTAAFTVLTAWHRVRELPENRAHRKPLGSFEEWADLVAGAVSWLTGKNPVDLIEERTDQDPVAAEERLIIEALAKTYGDTWWTAREAAKAIDRELWAAAIKLKGDTPDSGSVGRWLRSRKDRVFGGHVLTNEADRNGIAKWRLKVRGIGGCAGDSNTSRAKNGEDAKSEIGIADIPLRSPYPPHPEGGASDDDEGVVL
jgi:hypothetical protein